MSTTFSIGCLDCRESLWIGQTSCGGPLGLYGNDSTNLPVFLMAHMGHRLRFYPDHTSPMDDDEHFYRYQPTAAPEVIEDE
jgi:hypothetical protein